MKKADKILLAIVIVTGLLVIGGLLLWFSIQGELTNIESVLEGADATRTAIFLMGE